MTKNEKEKNIPDYIQEYTNIFYQKWCSLLQIKKQKSGV